MPRFSAENLSANEALVDRVRQLAGPETRRPARWHSRGSSRSTRSSCRSPGTRRRERIDENAGATTVALSADDIAELDALVDQVGVAGNRYDDGGMAMVGL